MLATEKRSEVVTQLAVLWTVFYPPGLPKLAAVRPAEEANRPGPVQSSHRQATEAVHVLATEKRSEAVTQLAVLWTVFYPPGVL